MQRHIILLAGLISASTAPALSQEAAKLSADGTARATMVDRDGNETGTVSFSQTPTGHVHVIVELANIPAGAHGFHIHEKGSCETGAGFESAGAHYSGGHAHGFMADKGPHVGDLPNLHAGEDGVVKAEFFVEGITLAEDGENPLRDTDGSAVVVHAGPDDYASQPSGGSGDRIACGVIE